MSLMHRLQMPVFRLNPARLLGMVCLLFVTAQLSFAQADPTVSINDLTVNEGDTGFFTGVFNITLSAPSTKTVSVTASTQNGSATGDVDFGAGSIGITFQPGQTSIQLTVFIIGDTAVEGTENFFVNLSNPVNATIGRGQGTATIIDDDSLVLLKETTTQRAAALDSVIFTAEPFPIINGLNFSSDNRTRILVFATGLKLANGEPVSNVTASAEDAQGGVRQLTVEFAGRVPNFDWLYQVVIKLNDSIPVGDHKIRISLHGQTSNPVLVNVKTQ